ncbi:PEP-CTERM sorting domain-containing protein [Oxalobacteraceae bacterium]|nr:PEP-CTERM sorting domain-containing protein [Oxalobacteraceae bacterium]
MKRSVIALSLCALSGLAQAGVIDFNRSNIVCTAAGTGLGTTIACGNGSVLAQSYGDVAGSLDVSYASLNQPNSSLRVWDADYNNLRGVVYGDGNDGNSAARIDLLGLGGKGVTLSHFDLGAYSNTSRGTHLTISAIGGPVLYSYDGNVGGLPGNIASSFDGNWSSASGLRIEWRNSAYNVGIDNITYAVTAVPEPSAYLMLGAGLFGLGLLARRTARRG